MTKILFTSNYARSGKDPLVISISVARPRWYPRIGHLPILAPTWDMVKAYKGDGDIPAYLVEFDQILAKLDPKEVVAQIPENSILLCYEKPTDFCHRQIVREWLNSSGEAIVNELVKPGEKAWSRKSLFKPKQPTVFDL